jgi:hypothetical protein
LEKNIPDYQYTLVSKGARTNTSLLSDPHLPTSALWLSQLDSLSWESYTPFGTKTLDLVLMKHIDKEEEEQIKKTNERKYLPSFLVFTYTIKKCLSDDKNRMCAKLLIQ